MRVGRQAGEFVFSHIFERCPAVAAVFAHFIGGRASRFRPTQGDFGLADGAGGQAGRRGWRIGQGTGVDGGSRRIAAGIIRHNFQRILRVGGQAGECIGRHIARIRPEIAAVLAHFVAGRTSRLRPAQGDFGLGDGAGAQVGRRGWGGWRRRIVGGGADRCRRGIAASVARPYLQGIGCAGGQARECVRIYIASIRPAAERPAIDIVAGRPGRLRPVQSDAVLGDAAGVHAHWRGWRIGQGAGSYRSGFGVAIAVARQHFQRIVRVGRQAGEFVFIHICEGCPAVVAGFAHLVGGCAGRFCPFQSNRGLRDVAGAQAGWRADQSGGADRCRRRIAASVARHDFQRILCVGGQAGEFVFIHICEGCPAVAAGFAHLVAGGAGRFRPFQRDRGIADAAGAQAGRRGWRIGQGCGADRCRRRIAASVARHDFQGVSCVGCQVCENISRHIAQRRIAVIAVLAHLVGGSAFRLRPVQGDCGFGDATGVQAGRRGWRIGQGAGVD